jgi:hypothetical protein
MMRYLVLAAAACLAGCVTPLPVADQAPVMQYSTPNRTLVAVVDDRVRTEEGRAENFAGFARNYGIPVHWTVETLMYASPEDKDKTMAQLLSSRIVSGMSVQGGDVAGVSIPAALSDDDARALLGRENAQRLMTVQLKDWHFDLNINWVGRFQFNTDAIVTVQTPEGGTILTEQFAERASIQAEGDESWGNMLLTAYREKLEQVLHDPDVRAALTAPPAPPPEAAAAAPDTMY